MKEEGLRCFFQPAGDPCRQRFTCDCQAIISMVGSCLCMLNLGEASGEDLRKGLRGLKGA